MSAVEPEFFSNDAFMRETTENCVDSSITRVISRLLNPNNHPVEGPNIEIPNVTLVVQPSLTTFVVGDTMTLFASSKIDLSGSEIRIYTTSLIAAFPVTFPVSSDSVSIATFVIPESVQGSSSIHVEVVDSSGNSLASSHLEVSVLNINFELNPKNAIIGETLSANASSNFQTQVGKIEIVANGQAKEIEFSNSSIGIKSEFLFSILIDDSFSNANSP
jgi:hypothetical protein